MCFSRVHGVRIVGGRCTRYSVYGRRRRTGAAVPSTLVSRDTGHMGEEGMTIRGATRRRSGGQPSAENDGSIEHVEVTRDVKVSVQNILWGRAAGRCQFPACNRELTRTPATQETRNLAEKAHIRAFSRGGPRSDDEWPAHLINDVENLLLLCQDCHITIDRAEGPDKYTAVQLAEWKAIHEQRVETATGITASCHTHIVTYGTSVGAHHALPTFRTAAEALFPNAFPASSRIIELGTRATSLRDHDDEFWMHERRQLAYHYEQRVRIPLELGELAHLSIFALAPQPLLIDLGVLIGDITSATTYQLHREPAGWNWPADGDVVTFDVHPPQRTDGPPALVLAVSATITLDRITRVLGEDAAIWMLTVKAPHNDLVKSPLTLREFRTTLRKLLDTIKAQHGERTPLHVFPALPVSLAVEFGRARMPKADTPWVIYDQNQTRGGFVSTLTISQDVHA